MVRLWAPDRVWQEKVLVNVGIHFRCVLNLYERRGEVQRISDQMLSATIRSSDPYFFEEGPDYPFRFARLQRQAMQQGHRLGRC